MCLSEFHLIAQQTVTDNPTTKGASATATPALRELIVSHADDNGVLQLFEMREDGTSRRQLTDSKHGCVMPACSPDGKKLIYAQQSQRGMTLMLADIDGTNPRALTEPGKNLVPSWLPDSRHIVWMASDSKGKEDPARNSQIRLLDTETMESRRLFSDPEQIKFSNAMPVVSPDGKSVAFVSNRSGNMRVWVSELDGGNARMISPPEMEYHDAIKAPIEQKVPAWSPDGKWIAHWEGVEMIHMSRFTGIQDRERDQLIAATFHVWVAAADGKNRRKSGRGDDPTWSPDGFVTRAFPDQKRGGPKIMIETATEPNFEPRELPLVPPGSAFGRFTWKVEGLPQRHGWGKPNRSPATQGQTEEGKKPKNTLKLGRLEFEVIYPGDRPSDELNNLIVDDLEFVFSHLGDPMLTELDFTPGSPANPWNATHSVSYPVGVPGKYWPKSLSRHFFSARIFEDRQGVIIPGELVEDYEKAVELGPNTGLREAIDQLLTLEFREPSLLEYRERTDDDATILVVKTLAREKRESDYSKEINLVFDEGYWRASP